MSEIERADPRARRTAVVILAAGAALGAVTLVLIGRWRLELVAWMAADPGARVAPVALGVTLVTAGTLVGLAGYLWHLASRITRAGRFPPPGLRVVRDTPVVTGLAATRLSRLARVLGAVLAAAAAALVLLIWRLVRA